MLEHHFYFTRPTDTNTKVWRYLSFTKFVSVLESKGLFFARADQFADPFDGLVPERARQAIASLLSGIAENPSALADEFLRLTDFLRQFTFVNCWHVNDTESDAMWKLYGQSDQCVAIQSTVGMLEATFAATDERIFLGAVRYANEADIPPDVFFNGLTPYIFKRKSFEHERELRAILGFDVPNSTKITEAGIRLEPPAVLGRVVPVDLEQLVQNVLVSPVAPPWFGDLVQAMLDKYGLCRRVLRSTLYQVPPREQRVEPDTVSKAFSLPVSVIEHLHRQHLLYTELEMRERERLAQRQHDATFHDTAAHRVDDVARPASVARGRLIV